MAVDEYPNLDGKTYIVVGSTSGIGKATVERLANCGARIVMASRDREKCQRVRRDIVLSTRNKQVYCRQCDLTDFDSVRQFVSKIYKGPLSLDRIDGVLHSAAVMEPERRVNREGVETSLATNHLGPFLLTGLLLQKLLNQDHASQIIFLNTKLATKDSTKLDLTNLNSEPVVDSGGKKNKWRGYDTYKSTKLAELLFTRELAERLQGSKVSVLAVDPGWTKTRIDSNTPLQRFFLTRWAMNAVGYILGRQHPNAAAKRVVHAFTDEKLDAANGLFIGRNYKEQEWGKLANDAELRQRLWLTSEKWTRYDKHLDELMSEVGKEAFRLDSEQQPPVDVKEKKMFIEAFVQRWIPWF